jgi:hypothetical protein
MYEINLQICNKNDGDAMKNIPVMPVASKPRYLVIHLSDPRACPAMNIST